MSRLLLAVLLALPAAPAAASPSVKKLERQLADGKSVEQMIEAITALGKTHKAAAYPPLGALFDVRRNSPRVSQALVRAFIRLKDKRAEEPLLKAWDYLGSMRLELGDDGLPPHLVALRESVAEALGVCGGRAAGDALLEALSDQDRVVAENAARGLGRLGDKRAVGPLIDLLSRGGGVGQAAFEALADIGDPRAEAAVEQALGNQDMPSRAEAAYALARVSKRKRAKALDALERIENDQRVEAAARSLAAYYLLKLDERGGLEYLTRELEKGTTARRSLAAQLLGQSGSERAAAPLIDGLRSEDPAARELCVRALGALGGSRAVSPLRQRLHEDANLSVRAAAREELEDLGER